MINKGLLLAIVLVTAILMLAAVEFLPGSSYFPVVEYTVPGNVQFVMLRQGVADQSSCENIARDIEQAVRVNCAECYLTKRCVRGLDDEQRRLLSREPIPTPSLRSEDGHLTMTVTAADAEIAMGVCRSAAEQTASRSADKRLICFAASAPR